MKSRRWGLVKWIFIAGIMAMMLFGCATTKPAKNRMITVEYLEHLKFFRETTPAQIEELTADVVDFKNTIPAVVEVYAGKDAAMDTIGVAAKNNGYTYAILYRFEDIAGLEAFLVHPAHKNAVKKYLGATGFIRDIQKVIIKHEPVPSTQ